MAGASGTPLATYRVQLHAGFTFDQAAELAPYLAEIGVSHLYCSPYLQAAPGSTHGYDVVDPNRLSDELGGEPGYRRLLHALKRCGLGHLFDVVPNHMAAHPANPWWRDVLTRGPHSPFATYFDIDWQRGACGAPNKVLVAILGDRYAQVLESGQLTLARRGARVEVRYFDHVLPLSPESEAAVVESVLGTGRASHPGRAWWHSGEALAAVDRALEELNASPERLDMVLGAQHYVLAYWRTASEELNYRRFFTIETLVGLRAEAPRVFEDTHRLVRRLVKEGAVDGLRIDHVDGLADPKGYLTALRERVAPGYTVVEKILEPGESLADDWPVEGTTGYDFLYRVNNLFVASGNEEALSACYEHATGEKASYGEVVHAAKCQVMETELVAEIRRLTAQLVPLCARRREQRDRSARELRRALIELLAALPVYRTYARPGAAPSRADRQHVAEATAALRRRHPDLDPLLVTFLGRLLLLAEGGAEETAFGMGLAQLSAAVMAKGVEDTALYRYHRLVSLNEVGGDPGVFGAGPEEYHSATATVAERWPDTLLTLSTHDTKRSADVRARLHVLSEVPGPWGELVADLTDLVEADPEGARLDPNTEYLAYQTLVGAWPLGADRLATYLAKATKEAKVHTSWTEPDPDYDASVERFARRLARDRRSIERLGRFLAEWRIVERGRRNSLAQMALLLTSPGVPDLYQGSELWDLALVDPDNRRPVDYRLRRDLLGALTAAPASDLAADGSGRLKLWLVSRLLVDRWEHPESWRTGPYEPLFASGPGAARVVAFRRHELVVVVPRLADDASAAWPSTTLSLPSGRFRHLLTGRELSGGRHDVAPLLGDFPVAVLRRSAR